MAGKLIGRGMLVCVILSMFFLSDCKREARVFEPEPRALRGAKSQYEVTVQSHSQWQEPRVTNWYEQNAYALARGEELFRAFNCVGCHAHGGGGMGPALMDAKWRYG